MPGAPCAPAASRAKQKSAQVSHRRSPETPGIPRAIGFNGFLRALPGEPGFLATIASAMRQHRRQLDTSVGASGPHGFAVREPSALVSSATRVHRIPPAFVTIAKRPLLGRDGWRSIAASTRRPSRKFSIRGLDSRCKSTGTQIQSRSRSGAMIWHAKKKRRQLNATSRRWSPCKLQRTKKEAGSPPLFSPDQHALFESILIARPIRRAHIAVD